MNPAGFKLFRIGAQPRWADQGAALDLLALNVGVNYRVAVEAFDGNGVLQRTKAVRIR